MSVMVSAATRAAAAEGVNIRATVHWAPPATELAQVSVSVKSLAFWPVTVRLVILKVALPVLVSVIV